MAKRDVIEFAKKQGYAGAKYLGQWKGYSVYDPTFDGPEDELAIVGPPLVILEKGDRLRMSTVDECFAILDEVQLSEDE